MDITSNPWVVTAADVVSGPVTVWQYKCFIDQIEFEQYTNTTDSATINQYSGKSFAFLHGASDFETVRTGKIGHSDGIVIPQAGITATGTLRIYHR
jgi:hypothetical protein